MTLQTNNSYNPNKAQTGINALCTCTLQFHPQHCTVLSHLLHCQISTILRISVCISKTWAQDNVVIPLQDGHTSRDTQHRKKEKKIQEEGSNDENVCTSTPGAWEMRRKLHMFCSPQITITPLASTTAETYSKHLNGLMLLQVALNIPKSTTLALQSSLPLLYYACH
jgi:hypothetical protein